MKLGIVTSLWGRPRLTRLFGEYYDGLNIPGVELIKAAAYSEARDAAPLSDSWIKVYADNDPRSDKWNAASQALAEHGPDAILIVGSDDFVHSRHIERGLEIILQGQHLIHPRTCYFFDTVTRCLALGTFSRVGAGRMISGELADSLDYVLWEPGQIRNIDRSMGLRMVGTPVEWHPEPKVLDVKVQEERGTNIWSYDYLSSVAEQNEAWNWTEIHNPHGWLAQFFPRIANRLFAYHDDYL